MKKFVFLFIAVFVSVVAQAQFKVFSDGDVGIGATNPASKFCINTDGYSGALAFFHNSNGASSPRTLQINQKAEGTGWVYSLLVGVDQSTGGNNLVGVYGCAYRSSYRSVPTFGVYGVTGNGADGYNYGVYGELLGSNDGAAIYGTTDGVYDVNGEYAGYFRGKVKVLGELWVNDSQVTSDISLKKEIRTLETDVVTKIQQLNGVKYKLKHPTELPKFLASLPDTLKVESLQSDINSKKYTDDRIGLIAQDLEKVYPELVKVDDEGYLGINYIGLIPVLIEAIKEQQRTIDTLTKKIGKLGPEISNLKSEITSTSGNSESENYLSQNRPNPFNQKTEIEFFIASEYGNASLLIYDMQGTQIQSYNIQERGNSSVIINGSEFNPGMYLYTLIVDGSEIDTKRMILTD